MVGAVVSRAPPVDERGQAVRLGPSLGRGGEGAVYGVDGRPDVVAKLYHQPPDPALAAKLAAMTALQTPALLAAAAWPLGTLHDGSSGAVVGLLMPRIADHKPIHQLYGPKSRLVEFPSADFRFLVHAAANLARAFAVVHRHGHVVGDVNHANALVDARAIVRFIDCDSFQVAALGRLFLCEVGVPTHQAPEVQRRPSLRGFVRSPNHDSFGLAVLIFQLLVLGRHPFAGRYLGVGEMPIERAIREHRFAYGSGAAARQMQPPPYTPLLDAFTPAITARFERAFGPTGEAGTRPSAEEWAAALETLAVGLTDCPRRAGHVFPGGMSGCPWCDVEARLSARLFPLTIVTSPTPTFDLAATWMAIEAVVSPGLAPLLPPSRIGKRLEPSPLARRIGRRRRQRRGAGVLVALAGLTLFVAGLPSVEPGSVAGLALGAIVAAFLGWPRTNPELRQLQLARVESRQRCRQAETRWKSEAGEQRFLRRFQELEAARREYLDLPARRRREHQLLDRDPQRRQREQFLETYRVADAHLKGIGLGRKATLASYGIETAADLTQVALARLPQFGPALIQPLLDWRRQLEASFPTAPSHHVDRADLEALDRELLARRSALEATLKQGATELNGVARIIQQARFTLRPVVLQARRERDQAEADWLAASGSSPCWARRRAAGRRPPGLSN